MANRQADPDEDEAQRKKRFLEDGATVRVDTVRRYPPAKPRVVAEAPVTVEVPETADLPERLAADTDAVIILDFGILPRAPNFSVLVFVNTPSPGVDTTVPGFVGAVAFFLGEEHDGHPVRAVLPAGNAIKRLGRRGAVSVTLVPVAATGEPVAIEPLDVTATVELVRSTVG